MYVRVSVICIEFKVLILYAAADNQFVTLAQCFAYQNSIKSGAHTHAYAYSYTVLQLHLHGCNYS